MRVTTFESPLGPYVGHYPLLPRPPAPAGVAERLRRGQRGAHAGGDRGGQPAGAARVRAGAARHARARAQHRPRGARRAGPARLRQPGRAQRDRDAAVRRPARRHPLDRPARHRPVRDGVRPVRAGPPGDACRSPPRSCAASPRCWTIEGGEAGTARSWRTEEIVSYESGFKRELVAFHDSAVSGTAPVTSGRDGLRDIALCQAIIESHRREGRWTTRPSPAGKGPRGEHSRRRPGRAIAVANAPVSYGAFEITVGHDPNVPDGMSVLDQVAAAGLRGHRPRPGRVPGQRDAAGGAAGRAGPGPGRRLPGAALRRP